MLDHPVPEITHPLGRFWCQPRREEFLVDEHVAVMTPETLAKFHEYSSTIPTGVYPGKAWVARLADGVVLRWFGVCDVPGYCRNHQRPILLVDNSTGPRGPETDLT